MSHALAMQTQKSIEYHECVSITDEHDERTKKKQTNRFDRIKRMSEMSDTWIEFLCYS